MCIRDRAKAYLVGDLRDLVWQDEYDYYSTGVWYTVPAGGHTVNLLVDTCLLYTSRCV